MSHDYRSETHQQDWEPFHPGNIGNTGRLIGGPEELAGRLAAMNADLTQRKRPEGPPARARVRRAAVWEGCRGSGA
jgi:hypothetical protein